MMNWFILVLIAFAFFIVWLFAGGTARRAKIGLAGAGVAGLWAWFAGLAEKISGWF